MNLVRQQRAAGPAARAPRLRLTGECRHAKCRPCVPHAAAAGSVQLREHPGQRDTEPAAGSNPQPVSTELDQLLGLLPAHVAATLRREHGSRLPELLEIVLDLGRLPLARFPGSEAALGHTVITAADLQAAAQKLGSPFDADNRAGIDATLHRISALRSRSGGVVGLTCRVGRAVSGAAALAADLAAAGESILLLGPPGIGKTTIIRDLSRLLADEARRRVVIVDTSNEIGGDGDVPHAAIGGARRMQVPDPAQQHRVMIEAVENHMPQVVVVDEISSVAECRAARTIGERGVQLIATAHGSSLDSVVKNPSLADLVGGVTTVTLGDESARGRAGGSKTIQERAGPPTFTAAVELLDRSRWLIHADVAASVDALLCGRQPPTQLRQLHPQHGMLSWKGQLRSVGGEGRAASRDLWQSHATGAEVLLPAAVPAESAGGASSSSAGGRRGRGGLGSGSSGASAAGSDNSRQPSLSDDSGVTSSGAASAPAPALAGYEVALRRGGSVGSSPAGAPAFRTASSSSTGESAAVAAQASTASSSSSNSPAASGGSSSSSMQQEDGARADSPSGPSGSLTGGRRGRLFAAWQAPAGTPGDATAALPEWDDSPGGAGSPTTSSSDEEAASKHVMPADLATKAPLRVFLALSSQPADKVWATLKALDAKDRLQRAPFASAADAIVASKARAKYSPKLRQQAARMHTPLLLIKSSSAAALHRELCPLLGLDPLSNGSSSSSLPALAEAGPLPAALPGPSATPEQLEAPTLGSQASTAAAATGADGAAPASAGASAHGLATTGTSSDSSEFPADEYCAALAALVRYQGTKERALDRWVAAQLLASLAAELPDGASSRGLAVAIWALGHVKQRDKFVAGNGQALAALEAACHLHWGSFCPAQLLQVAQGWARLQRPPAGGASAGSTVASGGSSGAGDAASGGASSSSSGGASSGGASGGSGAGSGQAAVAGFVSSETWLANLQRAVLQRWGQFGDEEQQVMQQCLHDLSQAVAAAALPGGEA